MSSTTNKTSNILQIVQKLQAGKDKERKEAFENLDRALNQLRSSGKIHKLRDEAWTEILDTIFDLAKSDKHDIFEGSAASKKRAESRLENVASGLRLVVSYCNNSVHAKTANIVLDHIIGLLSFDRENELPFRQIIQSNYVRTFEIITSNAAHGEHTQAANWQKYVDWLLEAIDANLATLTSADEDVGEPGDLMSFTRGNSVYGSVKSSVPLKTSESGNTQGPRSQEAQIMDSLVTSLRNLASISNCPLQTRMADIAQTILRALTTSIQAKEVAFECLNNVLMVARTEKVSLVSHTAAQTLVMMRKSWSYKIDEKSASLREQMLISLMLIRHALERDALVPAEIDRSAVVSLVRHLADEYADRAEQYCLHLDDLLLSDSCHDTFFMRSGIAPNDQSSKAVANWTTISLIVNLTRLINSQYPATIHRNGADAERPRKRLRTVQPFTELVQLLFTDVRDVKFHEVTDFCAMNKSSLEDDRSGRASWVLLTLGKLCRCAVARDTSLKEYWMQAWNSASRLITSTFNSRAACYYMFCVMQSGILHNELSAQDVISSCFQSGSRGPPELTDTSLVLFTACLRSKSLRTERDFVSLSDKILGWLDIVWSLPAMKDYRGLANTVRMGSPDLLFSLCTALNGVTIAIKQPNWAPYQFAIFRAFAKMTENADFANFIATSSVSATVNLDTSRPTRERITVRPKDSSMVVNDFLAKKLDILRDAYHEVEWNDCGNLKSAQLQHARRRTNVSHDMVEILIIACTVYASFSNVGPANSHKECLARAWTCVLDYVKLQSEQKSEYERICTTVVRTFSRIVPIEIEDRFLLSGRRSYLVQSLRKLMTDHDLNPADPDEMEIDFFDQPFESQQSQGRSQSSNRSFARRDYSVQNVSDGLLAGTRFRLLQDSLSNERSQIGDLTVSSMDFVINLSAESLLAIRAEVLEWLTDNVYISSKDATRLLQHVAQICLQSYDYERNEVALCFCIRVLRSMQVLWLTTEYVELTDMVNDIYTWFIKKLLGKGLASDEVSHQAALLLDTLLRHKPRFGTDLALPSPRTTLFGIVKTAASSLRFRLIGSLEVLFEGYILSEHAAIFDDIVDCLPTDPYDEAGIAVRLYTLAKLGSRWRTVLRQAVYHVFETAAKVPGCTQLAHKSLQIVAKEVDSNFNPAKLLHLFGPQLFFTWLEDGAIDTMPYAAFGFQSLKELVFAERRELVAQAVMRSNLGAQHMLTDLLGLSWTDLLDENFPAAWVYAIATDTSETHSGANTGPAEDLLRDQLTESNYHKLCQHHFAEGVACLMVSLADDRGFDKVISHSQHYKGYKLTAETIQQKGYSSVVHPSRQQPSFRAKYLMQILSKLCTNANLEPRKFWTPALLVLVYRKLFDDAEPALGPLHVAGMIRRLRIVIILAGSVVFRGYPLEMVLLNLRPYLTNFQCVEDTVGLVWFLLENSTEHLAHHLPYLTGLSVSIFASLSIFVKGSQESTTQESQFVSTMSKALEFRQWLGQYLESLDTSNLDQESVVRYCNIIEEAKEISQSGTNNKHEPEGRLIHYILLDQSAAQPLITSTLFEVILQHMSRDFRRVQELGDDILQDSEDLIQSAKILWSIISDTGAAKAFLTWGGTMLGRAYAYSGPGISAQLINSDKSQSQIGLSLLPLDSCQSIMKLVTSLLWSPNSSTASLAESTARTILSSMPKNERTSNLLHTLDWTNLSDLVLDDGQCPSLPPLEFQEFGLDKLCDLELFTTPKDWAAAICQWLILQYTTNDFLNGLLSLIRSNNDFGTQILPLVVHVIFHEQVDNSKQEARNVVSQIFSSAVTRHEDIAKGFVDIVLTVITYLHRCVIPLETSPFRRYSWLEVDAEQTAHAALSSGSPHTALLLLEISRSEQIFQAMGTRGSRRSSTREALLDVQLVSTIYRAVDDDDFFYASHQEHDIMGIMAKLKHEGQGSQLLALESAAFDSSMKSVGSQVSLRSKGADVISALSLANLHSIAFVTQQYAGSTIHNVENHSFAKSLLNVHQWDVPLADSHVEHDSLVNSLMSNIQTFQLKEDLLSSLDDCVLSLTSALTHHKNDKRQFTVELGTLASLSNVQTLLESTSKEALDNAWDVILAIQPWSLSESFDSISTMLTVREAAASAMRANEKAVELFKTNSLDLLKHEIRSVRSSLKISLSHDVAQFRLNRAVYLSRLQKDSDDVGFELEKAIVFDVANTLWTQGEVSVPIEMLKTLQEAKPSKGSAVLVSDAELLSDLGQKLSQARLDRIDEITAHYLQPAIDALGKAQHGPMAGRVYHNFAVFCDKQLQDSAAKDDFERVTKLRHRKMQEVNELAEIYSTSSGTEKNVIKNAYAKAKVWFKLDDEEYRRLKENREQLLQKSLENYLCSLQACDDYSKDVLRLMSLWLGNAEISTANKTMSHYQKSVPSIKLAPFMNQLASRLLDNAQDDFQRVLGDVLFRISSDHPYHSHYQLFAVAKTKGAPNDPIADSRHRRAKALTTQIHSKGDQSAAVWISINNSSVYYTAFAQEKLEKEYRTGAKIPLRTFKSGVKLEQTLHNMSQKIPPPTMSIPLRTDRNYSSVPVFNGFEPQISVAGGVSAPKIVTVVASDGLKYKMLLKGGNDDLRQDAIMEQVFAQTSELLQEHRSTRQRNLGIRTYKVVPLTHSAGIIEFVQNTIPLHDYLLPAHTRYFPKDMKSNACRKKISDAQSKKPEERLKAYREVTQQFQPVMRFFFMERFLDPDEWFRKRLNYSRTCAAISILGHVLGLGDRHGHNILLDESTGEVVHIDLGVAFEAGRVLPVPEVVPFRLTRDLVDGMGISGVEGPFRRCCNFTLEALRKSQDAIMTILDVLRWDPLYGWSTSPLRVQRIQAQQEQEAAAQASREGSVNSTAGNDYGDAASKKLEAMKALSKANEPGEADRALAVVSKKLTASLSVEATVNELIRDATDEKNLAVLYCGWAAYV